MLLKEKLNLYKKDDLKVFADDIGLAKLSKLKKAELVERVAAMLSGHAAESGCDVLPHVYL